MKRACVLSIVLCCIHLQTEAVVQDREIPSDIEEVTVYRNGAQVSRNASVTLQPGRNEILFTGLSRRLNPKTLQLGGAGDYLLLSLSHQLNYLAEHPHKEQLQKLIAKRDSLNRLIDRENVSQTILDRELNILLSNQSLKGEQQNLSANEIKQAMDYFHEKLTEIESQKLELKRSLEELNEELKKVNKQISELNNDRNQTTSEVLAVIESDAREQIELSLSYLVSNAGWYPSYDVRVSDIDSPVDLSYKANIFQSTGVDWNEVRLTVSSAIPDRGGVLPSLDPWYIDFYEPVPQEEFSDAQSRQELKMQAAQAADQAEQEKGRRLPVQVVQNQTSFSYRIDVPYSIASGGKELTVEVINHDMPAEYRYYASPKLRQQVYLTARIPEWDQYNLLRGDANLFFENTYVGKANINPQSVQDTLSFSLGKDESLIIERTKLREFQEKNFFGSRIRETFAWKISIRNTKSQSISIEVEDQIPVSQHEDIKVELQERSEAQFDRQTGRLVWKIEVEPNQTREVRFRFQVEYPKGKQLPLN